MPLLEFENMGRVSDSILMSGTVMTIDYEKDLMDVSVAVPGFKDDGSVKFDTLLVKGVSVYYHCEDSVDMNGESLKGGASAFFPGDKVVVMADDRVSSKYRVIAHDKSKRPCLKRCVLWTLPSKNSSPCFQLWSISQSKNDEGKVTYSFKPVKWTILVKNDKTGALEEKSDLYSFYNFYKASQIKDLTDSNSYFIFSPPAEDTSSFTETGVNFEYKFLLLALWNSNGPLVSTSDQRVHGSAYTTSGSSQYTSFWVHKDYLLTEAIFRYAYRFYYNKATKAIEQRKIWAHDRTSDSNESMNTSDPCPTSWPYNPEEKFLTLTDVSPSGKYYYSQNIGFAWTTTSDSISDSTYESPLCPQDPYANFYYCGVHNNYTRDQNLSGKYKFEFISPHRNVSKNLTGTRKEKTKTESHQYYDVNAPSYTYRQTWVRNIDNKDSRETYVEYTDGGVSDRGNHCFLQVVQSGEVKNDTLRNESWEFQTTDPDGGWGSSPTVIEKNRREIDLYTREEDSETVQAIVVSSFGNKEVASSTHKIVYEGRSKWVYDIGSQTYTSTPTTTTNFSGTAATNFSCEAGKDYVLYTCVIQTYKSDGSFDSSKAKRTTKYITRDGEFDVPPPLLQKSTISGSKNDLADGVKASDDFKICLHSFSGI